MRRRLLDKKRIGVGTDGRTVNQKVKGIVKPTMRFRLPIVQF